MIYDCCFFVVWFFWFLGGGGGGEVVFIFISFEFFFAESFLPVVAGSKVSGNVAKEHPKFNKS